MSDSDQRDYYCSMKFRYLRIDIDSRATYTCHAAKPHPIDFDWLSDNPGNLFNHSINTKERIMMLANQRAPSCEQNCWYAEDQGQISPRLAQGGQEKTHDVVIATPEILEITVGTDCNLTCSYCCKEQSSAWKRDLKHNGKYELSIEDKQRYSLTDRDLIRMQVSQNEVYQAKKNAFIFDEISRISPKAKKFIITGGEPFLHNKIIDLLSELKFENDTEIEIYTGLGINPDRLDRVLDQVSKYNKIKLAISAEGIGSQLEFNRYGIKWNQFETNIQSIISHHIPFHFHSTLSNLTVFGFKQFYDYYQQYKKVISFVYTPRMQAPHVMDPDSKDMLIQQFSSLPCIDRDRILQVIAPNPSEQERTAIAQFLRQFTQRRSDLSLNLYPTTFRKWLGLDYVV